MPPHPLDAPPELLRVVTAGSVDDDQLDQVETTSRERGDGRLDLALLTDGLRAEREPGITIDVAYRFFTTPKRSFILADTPGHVVLDGTRAITEGVTALESLLGERGLL